MSNKSIIWVTQPILVLFFVLLTGCGTEGISPTKTTAAPIARPSITLLLTTRTPFVFPSRTPTPNDGAAHIVIGDNYFDPTSLTIKVGTMVEWWHAGGGMHSITSLESKWTSIFPGVGSRNRVSFETPGFYSYVCAFHSGMGGTIQVIE
jgi:plastocyanin